MASSLSEFVKAKTVQLMADIDAGDHRAIAEFTRVCIWDRNEALHLMRYGEISERPAHRALAIYRATGLVDPRPH